MSTGYWALGQFWGSIRDFYKELNPATLSGAVDVIVVEQPNGDLVCTPFYVRFGKMGVLRSREKVVEIMINDETTLIQMKLSDLGEAYFVEMVEDGSEVPMHLATSPLPPSSMELMKRGLDSLRAAELASGRELSAPPVTGPIPTSAPPIISSSSSTTTSAAASLTSVATSAPQLAPQPIVEPAPVPTPAAQSPAPAPTVPTAAPVEPLNADGGIYLDDLEKVDPELADRYFPKHDWRKNDASTSQETAPKSIPDPSNHGTLDQVVPSPRSDGGYGSNPSSISAAEEHNRWFLDEERFQELLGDVGISMCGGLDRDAEITDEQFNSRLVSYDQLNTNPELLFSSELVVKLNGKYYNWRVAGPMLISILMYQQPLSEPAINSLVTKHGPRQSSHEARDTSRKGSYSSGVSSYFWWRRATSADPPAKTEEKQPQATTTTATLSDDQAQAESKDDEPVTTITTLAPAVTTGTTNTPAAAQYLKTGHAVDPALNTSTEDATGQQSPSIMSSSFEFDDRGALSDSEVDESKRTTFKARYKKTLLLNSDQLKSLNLKRGVNKASFSVTTKYQGTTICECEIWLWRYDDKIIISDIDGTITKSDVLGHILPRVGGGFWAHIGVAELFNRIEANDYKIIYLTARAIGMATQTKEYLRSVQQDKFSLPGGPLLLSPTSVLDALHREVIEKKPEIFKMSCLRDVAALFPKEINPFYAGFGNRQNDFVAYTAVGVPPNRIYIIEPSGRVAFFDKRIEFSYPRISDLVDHFFPPLFVPTKKIHIHERIPEEFSATQYWRSPLPDCEIDLDKFPKPLTAKKRSQKDVMKRSATTGLQEKMKK